MGRSEIPTATATETIQAGQAQIKSAGRVLDIIEALAAAPAGLGFAELSRAQRVPKSSLHGLLSVLTARGYVSLDAQRRTYGLGIRVWEAGQAYLRHRDVVREALPVMEEIVREINETVQLATLDGIENVYLAKVDCSHPIRLQSEVGKRLFAHATGLGKVLLAHLPDDELRARLDGVALPSFTPNTINQLPDLLRVLETIRERGFAVDDQEYTPGLRCVAVPICDLDDDAAVTAALSASIPLMRAGSGQLEAALRAVAAGSIEISRRLGRAHANHRLVALTHWQGDVMSAHALASARR
ncbi:MAG: IclR family transcriptional regulator [Thermomicrobiales bacterium]